MAAAAAAVRSDRASDSSIVACRRSGTVVGFRPQKGARRYPCAQDFSSPLPVDVVSLLSAQARRTLDIYVVDVEVETRRYSSHRQANRFSSTPATAVVLTAARDAGRIMEAIKDAGLTQIDHHITTHWHGDHFGALEEPGEADSDPGLLRSWADGAATAGIDGVPRQDLSDACRRIEARHRKARRPDHAKGLEWRFITSAGQPIQQARSRCRPT